MRGEACSHSRRADCRQQRAYGPVGRGVREPRSAHCCCCLSADTPGHTRPPYEAVAALSLLLLRMLEYGELTILPL
jgi:hypothetical protein